MKKCLTVKVAANSEGEVNEVIGKFESLVERVRRDVEGHMNVFHFLRVFVCARNRQMRETRHVFLGRRSLFHGVFAQKCGEFPTFLRGCMTLTNTYTHKCKEYLTYIPNSLRFCIFAFWRQIS